MLPTPKTKHEFLSQVSEGRKEFCGIDFSFPLYEADFRIIHDLVFKDCRFLNEFLSSSLECCSFSKCYFFESISNMSSFLSCDFHGCSFLSGINSSFRNCKFARCLFSSPLSFRLEYCNFSLCEFTYSDFGGARIDAATDFYGSRFIGCSGNGDPLISLRLEKRYLMYFRDYVVLGDKWIRASHFCSSDFPYLQHFTPEWWDKYSRRARGACSFSNPKVELWK